MDEPGTLTQRIVDAIAAFENQQMSISPESISVHLSPSSVVVTLQGVTCPAERNCARDKEGRQLLERFYTEAFDATRPVLETAIAGILTRQIERSSLVVDAKSGTGVILVSLAGQNAADMEVRERKEK
jgi:uncharacterized protein YbcI